MRRWLSLIGNRDGQVLYMVAGSMVVILGMSALAIDLGLLYHARTEAQRVADAAALAGAGIYRQTRSEAEARTAAIDWAARNQIRGIDAEVLPVDVDVIPDSQKVRVRVLRTVDRGNPIQTLFARAIGFDQVSVSASAAAQAWPAGGVNCLLPFGIPDRWSEAPGPPWTWPTANDRYEGAADNDVYVPWDPDNPGAPYTGYGINDRGTRILIKTSDPQGAFQPGWFYPIRLPGTSGGNVYRQTIATCPDPTVVYNMLEDLVVAAEPGNMVGPTRQGFADLIALDPSAEWSDSCPGQPGGCVINSAFDVSPRIRPVGLFDPRFPPPSGAHPFRLRNFVGMFVEEAQGNDFYVRFVEYTGVFPADSWAADAGPLAYVLRLVE